jgi:hypothetical protein
LTREDARQIGENAIGFFATLAEWSRVEMQPPVSDAGKSLASDDEDGATLRPLATGTAQ